MRGVVAALALMATAGNAMQDSLLPLSQVVWSSEAKHNYSGSPSILQVDGEYIVSYESFGGGPHPICKHGPTQGADVPDHDEPTAALLGSATPHWTRILASASMDGPWVERGAIQGQHFMTLFRPSWFKGAGSVMGFGVSGGPLPGENATVDGFVVSSSVDAGRTWSSTRVLDGHYATGPTPVVEWAGRVWRAVELVVPPTEWPRSFQAVLLSAPLHRLSERGAWTATPPLPFALDWVRPPWAADPWGSPGYLEGNAVPLVAGGNRTGAMRVVMRVNSLPYANVAMVLRLGDGTDATGGEDPPPDAPLTNVSMVAFPGGMSKFTIRHDAASGQYLSLTNNVTNTSCPSQRSVLTLSCSPDMLRWAAVSTLIVSDDGLSAYNTLRYTGFHYVDWQFDSNGDDIVASIRTAYRGADSYHNSNRVTAYRLPRFREALADCPR